MINQAQLRVLKNVAHQTVERAKDIAGERDDSLADVVADLAMVVEALIVQTQGVECG